MKKTTLPSFDEMVKLAKENPEELESIRKQMVDDVIESVDPEKRDGLRKIQSKINLIARGSKTPLDGATKIFNEMFESFKELDKYLQTFRTENNENKKPNLTIHKDK